jgi:DNA (cytosine-5)-methyltransferase 1
VNDIEYINIIESEFNKIGYDIYYKVYMCSKLNIGVPQNRERLIIVGIRSDLKQKFEFPPENKNKEGNLKNIVKSKVDELEKNKQKTDKKKSTSEPKWKQYSSISAAKKAGSLYYSKGGKKFAAVFAEDLKGVKGSSPSAKLRAYLNDKEKKRK